MNWKKVIAGVLVVGVALAQMVCLTACNGIKDFIQDTYNPPNYTDPSQLPGKQPSTPNTPIEPDVPVDPDDPDVPVDPVDPDVPVDPVDPVAPTTEAEYKEACEKLLNEKALEAIQRYREYEVISNVTDLTYNVKDGKIRCFADVGLSRIVKKYFEVETNVLFEGNTYEEALSVIEQMDPANTRVFMYSTLTRLTNLDNYDELCQLLLEKVEGDEIINVTDFGDSAVGVKTTFTFIKDGYVYDQSLGMLDKKLYSQKDYLNYVMENQDKLTVEIAKLKKSEYQSFDEIGAGVEEEA